MKFKIFDVVEISNGNKATILSADNEQYKAEIITEDGTVKEIVNLKEKDIRKTIYSR